jgi:hypothetical protein
MAGRIADLRLTIADSPRRKAIPLFNQQPAISNRQFGPPKHAFMTDCPVRIVRCVTGTCDRDH